MTVGNCELKIIPYENLGELGRREGPPALVEWKWYYHLLSFAFWALVFLPPLVIKENRRWQAWTIFIPLLAVVVACHMLANLFSFPPSAAQNFGTLVGSLACAWAVVWLWADWFSPRHWVLAGLFALFVMLATGLLWFVGDYGIPDSQTLAHLDDYHTVIALMVYMAVTSFSLLLSMALTGRFRRKAYLSASFMAWLLFWTVVSLGLGPLLLMVGVSLLLRDSHLILGIVVAVPLIGSIGGCMLYLFNVPFMLLAYRNPFYRQRFCRVFGLEMARPAAIVAALVEVEPEQAADT
jgi:hypothetical protein